jgi:hypothetical protein
MALRPIKKLLSLGYLALAEREWGARPGVDGERGHHFIHQAAIDGQ